jgi:hypothetical protein
MAQSRAGLIDIHHNQGSGEAGILDNEEADAEVGRASRGQSFRSSGRNLVL